MSEDFYAFKKDYTKISGEYTVDDIRKFISNITFTDGDKVHSTDEVMDNVISYNNYCTYSEISVDCFTIFWRFESCERKLTQLASAHCPQNPDGDIYFPILDKIYAIANSLHVQDDPFDDYEEAFYFDQNGLLKVARTLRLVDPSDENDDGVEIIMYEGMDESLYDDMINDFFYRAYIRYMCDLPDDLRKPITKMTADEYQVFLMYII
jgi:hypothetical protein